MYILTYQGEDNLSRVVEGPLLLDLHVVSQHASLEQVLHRLVHGLFKHAQPLFWVTPCIAFPIMYIELSLTRY